MAIRVQHHANLSKQATLLYGLDVSPLKCRVYGCGLNQFVHEGMTHISTVEVHLKTRSGNVNIATQNLSLPCACLFTGLEGGILQNLAFISKHMLQN